MVERKGDKPYLAEEERVVGVRIKALGVFDRKPISSEEIIDTLGNIGNLDAGELLIRYVKGRGEYRSSAVVALGKIKDVRAVEVLIESLDEKIEKFAFDPDRWEEIGWAEWPLRYFAIQALGEIGDPRAVGPLSNLLKSGDTNLTDLRQAIEALGEIGDVEAVDPLIQVLVGDDRKGDPDFLQSKAAKALGKIRDKRAVDPLIHALEDGSCHVREVAAEALAEIGWLPRDDVEKANYLVAKGDWDELVKLGKAGGKTHIGCVIE